MKSLLTAVSATLILLLPIQSHAGSDQFLPLAQANDNLPQPKIVGGEVAEQDNWPWMTAFVVTFEDISTSLQVAGVTYTSGAFTFSPSGDVSGEVVACGKPEDIAKIDGNYTGQFLRDLLNGILKKHTGLDEEQITHFTDRNFYMTAEMAKEYGIIDGVLSGPEKEGVTESEEEQK